MQDILGDFKDSIELLFAKKKNSEAPTEEPDIVNIMLSGITGVGKSTLINAIFGEDLAETGVGAPLTATASMPPASTVTASTPTGGTAGESTG